jgi:hypothetical protein
MQHRGTENFANLKMFEAVTDPYLGGGECVEHVCVLRRIKVESSKRWFRVNCDSQC